MRSYIDLAEPPKKSRLEPTTPPPPPQSSLQSMQRSPPTSIPSIVTSESMTDSKSSKWHGSAHPQEGPGSHRIRCEEEPGPG
ncbi:unnamed protein product [Tetraodon nigroviridis]|uniref:(spotted green pufferfish) hypothetical protein n=1 Tax=Tetraodon nigroviridis TaxID=99883 RepID=Q4T5B7_TETNG|nr:unnamed protein product [Tetraodon nigroviridis]